MLVREVMTTPVVTVSPHATVKQAIRLLYERNITVVPVVNGHEYLVSRRDLIGVPARSDERIHDDVVDALGEYDGPDRGPKGLWSFGGGACGPVAGARRVPMLDGMPVFRGAEVRGDALAAAHPAGW